MKINRKTAFVLVALTILLGVGIALAPQYLTKPATQMSFYVYSTQKDEGGFSLEMSPIFNLDGHLPRKMDFEINVWTPDGWQKATIALAPMTLPKTELNVEWVDIQTAQATSQDTKWNCLVNDAGEIVMYKDKPALKFQLDCDRTEPEVTADEKWGKGNGTYDRPYDPDLLEGKNVKVLYYEGHENGSKTYSRVKVILDGKEVWVRVGIGILLWTPIQDNGVTRYEPVDESRYWDLEDTGNVTDNFKGIWRVDLDYDNDFVEVYLPFKPTTKDQQIEKFWIEYQAGLKTMPYKGSWYMSNWDSSPYAKGYTMLENFPLISDWNEEDYGALFELVTGEKSEHTSIAHLWSVYGMGSGSWWQDDTYEDESAIQVMTFFRQPPNSEVLDTLTPCSANYPDLIRGLHIVNVEPATDIFGTIFSYWDFDPSEGFYVSLGFEGSEYTDNMAVLHDTYIGYIAADEFISDEWSVLDNRPAQYGTIYLYKVTGCQK